MAGFDIDQIAPGLYQGGRPPIGYNLKNAGFDVLVLTAWEHQPPDELFPGVEVLRARLVDVAPYREEDRAEAILLAREVAARVESGKRVLVTCYMGWNRSGWVTGHALRFLGVEPGRAVRQVQMCRSRALGNKSFARDIEGSRRKHPAR